MSRLALFFALTLLFVVPFASAEIPHLISLQGRLTDATDNPISSSTNFVFRIYPSETGGTALWTEVQTLSPDTLGIFSILLGSVAALNIPFNESYWLEVQVNSEILSPRTRMGSAGYALRSESPWNATGNNIYTTNSGNVGIGTASPSGKLHIKSVGYGLNLQTSVNPGTFDIQFYDADDTLGNYKWALSYRGMNENDDLRLFRNVGVPVMTWQNGTGNVGIGTTGPDPAAKLDVNGNIKASTIALKGTTPSSSYPLYLETGNTGAFFRFVDTNAGGGNIQMNSGGSGTPSTLYINDPDGVLINQQNGGYLAFATTNTEKVRIDSSGNVGIGVVPIGAAKLEVAGNVKIADGTQGAGKVLTSDANGVASWQAAGGVQYDAQGRISSGKLGFTQKVYKNNAGNSVFHANDAAASIGPIFSPTKAKETKLNKVPDNTLKIYFECWFTFEVGTWWGQAQIYRNGLPVGTVRGCPYSPGGSFTETISGWNDGDLLQVYIWMGTSMGDSRGTSVGARNLRILGTIEEELIQAVQ